MRHIDHPGPVSAQRRIAVDCEVEYAEIALAPGSILLDSLAEALDAHGVSSAVAKLRGGSFDPFVFYMPALSNTPAHAVYFSDRHEPDGLVQLEQATVTIGRREELPWLHCHGIWRDAEGNRLGGHVLPNEARIAEPVTASIWFLRGASFDVTPNPETAFSLFEPIQTSKSSSDAVQGIAVAVRANEDLCTALENECGSRGITHAIVRGGVGSLIGASFDDGRLVKPFVTEVFIREGKLRLSALGELEAQIEVSMVDHTGGLHEGRLQRGDNPVLVTFELVIEPLAFLQGRDSSTRHQGTTTGVSLDAG
jgi:predicted DNA-binding protein with PD1-like motif